MRLPNYGPIPPRPSIFEQTIDEMLATKPCNCKKDCDACKKYIELIHMLTEKIMQLSEEKDK